MGLSTDSVIGKDELVGIYSGCVTKTSGRNVALVLNFGGCKIDVDGTPAGPLRLITDWADGLLRHKEVLHKVCPSSLDGGW